MRKRKFATNEPVNDVFIVETIRKKKIRSNKEPLYFIKWKDWDDKYNTWEPQSNILDKSLIDIFEEEQREKQKLKRESSKLQDMEVAKETEIRSFPVELKIDDEMMKNKCDEKSPNDENLNKLNNETETRPKICLKILKHRIHVPSLKVSEKPVVNGLYDQEIEKTRKSQSTEDDWKFSSKFSPSFFSDHESANKSNDNSLKNNKPPTYKSELSWSKHLESGIRKPRKLLSINEYSAKMKKRHKKSKQDKLKSVEKQMKKLSYESQNEVNVENKEEQKIESKSIRSQYERPLVSLENQIDSWSKKSIEKEILSEQSVKDEEIKPLVERFKYHANTIVTDVTIRNLTVTIREMPYEDFIDSDTSRYINIRVPVESEWFTRYGGIIDNETNNDSDFDKEIVDDNQCEMSLKFDAKQKLIDRFSENMILGLRPPSRPRSVDSYKAVIDKNYSGSISKNLFSVTTSPRKTPAESQLSSNTEPQIPQKSPLHVNIDDCEEVDVVGGIESDHSFVGSLQAETVTMSTEIRQSLPINSNPVTSIIQSLLQSYSYNHSMMMPPLQAAPWLDSHNPSNQLYQLSCHNNKNIDNHHIITSNSCLPSRSYEPSVLKYSENTCLSLYRQPTDDMSDIYLTNQGQDTPIDLSLK